MPITPFRSVPKFMPTLFLPSAAKAGAAAKADNNATIAIFFMIYFLG
jgi:hypothetical protein